MTGADTPAVGRERTWECVLPRWPARSALRCGDAPAQPLEALRRPVDSERNGGGVGQVAVEQDGEDARQTDERQVGALFDLERERDVLDADEEQQDTEELQRHEGTDRLGRAP